MLQTTIEADTVVDMHHVIARLQLRQRSEELFLAHLGHTAPLDPLAEQLFFGDQNQMRIRKPETARKIADENGDGVLKFFATDDIFKSRFADGARNLVRCQQILEALSLGLLMARNGNLLPGDKPPAQPVCQRCQRMAALFRNVHPQIVVILAGNGNRRSSARLIENKAGQFNNAPGRYNIAQLGIGQEKFASRRVSQSGGRSLDNTTFNLLKES